VHAESQFSNTHNRSIESSVHGQRFYPTMVGFLGTMRGRRFQPPPLITESDHVLIEAVTERLQSVVICQIHGIERRKVEREQRCGLRQRCQHACMHATGQQGSLSEPYDELLVLDRAGWRSLVHASLPCFQQGTPIHKAPESAPDGPCHCLTLAKLFTDTPLHVCCGTRPLQAHKTANGFCYSTKKRVDRHGHAPVDSYSVVNRQPLLGFYGLTSYKIGRKSI
jgi:hypothetical protein